MTKDRNSSCLEMGDIARVALAADKKNNCEGRFIDFLRYCSARLEKGDQVQSIWRDYQATME